MPPFSDVGKTEFLCLVIIEGNWTRDDVFTAVQQSTHLPTFAPLLCHWSCTVILSKEGMGRKLRMERNQP